MRCEAHTQATLCRKSCALKLDSGQINFKTVAPGQFCRFVAQAAAPAQRGLDREASLLQKRSNVIRWPRLFGDASSKKSDQGPANERNGCGREEKVHFNEAKSRKNENEARGEASRQEKAGCDLRRHQGMQAECDAARKGSDNRNGRQL